MAGLRRYAPAAAIFTVALLTGVPLLLLLVGSLARNWYWPALWPGEWSLRAWRYIVAADSGILPALGTSVLVAGPVSLVAVAIAWPAARTIAHDAFRGKQVLLFALLLPVLAPPLAAAMGLHVIFLRLNLVDSVVGVALVHLIPAVPYATIMLAGAFSRFDPTIEAQARTLGARPWQVWRHVTLPALAPGVAVAAAFAFLISWSQYLLTLIIGGGRVTTLPLLLVGFQRGGDDAVGAALSLVFIAPTLLVFGAVARTLRDS